ARSSPATSFALAAMASARARRPSAAARSCVPAAPAAARSCRPEARLTLGHAGFPRGPEPLLGGTASRPRIELRGRGAVPLRLAACLPFRTPAPISAPVAIPYLIMTRRADFLAA